MRFKATYWVRKAITFLPFLQSVTNVFSYIYIYIYPNDLNHEIYIEYVVWPVAESCECDMQAMKVIGRKYITIISIK